MGGGPSPLEEAGSREDEELIRAGLGGDEAAFEALVLKHRRGVETAVSRFYRSRADVEDIAQEAFAHALAGLHQRRPGTPFRYWLLRIAINCSLDGLRRRKRRPARTTSELTEDEGAWLDRHLAAASKEEHRSMERSMEARSLLDRVLTRVAPKDRAVLYLMYAEEMPVHEVAQLLGWSKALVKVRAFRARRLLRRNIEDLFARRAGRK